MTNCICGEINARNCPVHQLPIEVDVSRKLVDQLTEFREALEFYACWTNWSQIPGKPDVYPIIQFDHEEVKMYGKEKPDIIGGKRAREVLNKFGGFKCS